MHLKEFLEQLKLLFYQIVKEHTVCVVTNRDCVQPDPIPNSEVKPIFADGSVGFPHVRVGRRYTFFSETQLIELGFFLINFSSFCIFLSLYSSCSYF
jgi:hypothetical protein